MQEAALLAERVDNAAAIGGMGEIAPRPARHQDLDARLAIFLEQQDTQAQLCGPASGKQAGRPRTYHDEIPARDRC